MKGCHFPKAKRKCSTIPFSGKLCSCLLLPTGSQPECLRHSLPPKQSRISTKLSHHDPQSMIHDPWSTWDLTLVNDCSTFSILPRSPQSKFIPMHLFALVIYNIEILNWYLLTWNPGPLSFLQRESLSVLFYAWVLFGTSLSLPLCLGNGSLGTWYQNTGSEINRQELGRQPAAWPCPSYRWAQFWAYYLPSVRLAEV